MRLYKKNIHMHQGQTFLRCRFSCSDSTKHTSSHTTEGYIVVWPTDATSVYVSTLDFQCSYVWYVNKHSADEEYKM